MRQVSVITITYNSKSTIEDTIHSVLQQRYRPLQYVLIDGASTDGTNEIIQGLIPELKSAGIDVVSISEQDSGISDAFNKGIKYSTGEIIGIINSGDSYTKDAIEDVMESDWNKIDLLCGDVLWTDGVNGLEYVRKSSLSWDKLKYEMTVMHPSCFVKKSAYENYGMFDTSYKYAMDYDLICRFYRGGAILVYRSKVVSEMLSGGVSDSNLLKIKDEICDINRKNDLSMIQIRTHWLYVMIRSYAAGIMKKLFGNMWVSYKETE